MPQCLRSSVLSPFWFPADLFTLSLNRSVIKAQIFMSRPCGGGDIFAAVGKFLFEQNNSFRFPQSAPMPIHFLQWWANIE